MDLNDVLRHAVAAGASDVHLKVGQPPVLRTDGMLTPATGKAVIYRSGVRIKNPADIVGVAACDSTWSPQESLLVFVAGPLISETSTTTVGGDIGNHVNFQGAPYIVNDFDMDNNTTVWASDHALDDDQQLGAGQRTAASDHWMYGMPGPTQTVTEVNPVQGSYAG